MSSTFNTRSSLYICEVGVYKLRNNIVLKILLSLTRIISCQVLFAVAHAVIPY